MTNDPAQPATATPESPTEQEAKFLRRFNLGCVALIFGPFLLMGAIVLLITLAKWNDLAWDERLVALVLGGVFAAVGALPFLSSQLKHGWIVGKLKLQKQYPGQPWMWREDWARGVIEDRTPGQLWGHWVGVAIVCAICGILYGQRGQMAAFDYFAGAYPVILRVVLAVTVVAPAWLVVRAIHATLRVKRFGASTFIMSEIPCRIGGKLRGRIETPMQEVPPQGVGVSLSCLKLTRSGGKNRSTRVTTVRSDHHLVEVHRLGRGIDGIVVPIEFEIPPDGTPSGRESIGRRFLWRLVATAALPGVDYRAEFDPPVFRVSADGRVNEDGPAAI